MEMPGKCPACGADMTVRVLECSVCGTETRGEFSQNRFSRLSQEQTQFLEIFLHCRGSLKDLGANLGISYPTARSRLDDVILTLGLAERPNTKSRRLEVLRQLKDGEITSEEAYTLLSTIKGG